MSSMSPSQGNKPFLLPRTPPRVSHLARRYHGYSRPVLLLRELRLTIHTHHIAATQSTDTQHSDTAETLLRRKTRPFIQLSRMDTTFGPLFPAGTDSQGIDDNNHGKYIYIEIYFPPNIDHLTSSHLTFTIVHLAI